MKCNICGRNYNNPSFGGSGVCPSCDCGCTPDEHKMKSKNLTASTGMFTSKDFIELLFTQKDLKAAYQKGLKDGEAIENVEVYSYNKGHKKGYQRGYQKGYRAGRKRGLWDAKQTESGIDSILRKLNKKK